jgi:hypothetical protein
VIGDGENVREFAQRMIRHRQFRDRQFTSASGTLYTLSPSGNLMLPARYHRLTGSAEQSSEGTIEVACDGTGAHL